MKNGMLRLIATLSLILLLTPGNFWRSDVPPPNDAQSIEWVPVTLNPEKPYERRTGALFYLAGWQLRSPNSDFGGISSMLVEPDGSILALSDAGMVFRFSLAQNEATEIRSLFGPEADFEESSSDSESLVRDPETGQLWVGFEDSNAILRFGADLKTIERSHTPEAMQDWPFNGGPEAMVRLEANRFLVFAEDEEIGDGVTEALLFAGDPTDPDTPVTRFGYRPPTGYSITDATILPGDGRLIIINRRYTPLEGVSARISIANPAEIGPNTVLEGKVIAALEAPLTVDNMEAIAALPEPGKAGGEGRYIVWLASDDNFNSRQRTLLMKFRLDMERLNLDDNASASE